MLTPQAGSLNICPTSLSEFEGVTPCSQSSADGPGLPSGSPTLGVEGNSKQCEVAAGCGGISVLGEATCLFRNHPY